MDCFDLQLNFPQPSLCTNPGQTTNLCVCHRRTPYRRTEAKGNIEQHPVSKIAGAECPHGCPGARGGVHLLSGDLLPDPWRDRGEGPAAREKEHVVKGDEEGLRLPAFDALEHADARMADLFHPVLHVDRVQLDQLEPDGDPLLEVGLSSSSPGTGRNLRLRSATISATLFFRY